MLLVGLFFQQRSSRIVTAGVSSRVIIPLSKYIQQPLYEELPTVLVKCLQNGCDSAHLTATLI